MQIMISDLTYKIVAYSELAVVSGDECIDWAVEMLQLGHDTPSLLILAGLDKSTNSFELGGYLKRVLRELGLVEKSGDDAILSYLSYYLTKMAKGEDVKDNLKMVHDFSMGDHDRFTFDFQLLYWAWNDLDEYSEQVYWPAADKSNIGQIVIETAKKWVSENENRYQQ